MTATERISRCRDAEERYDSARSRAAAAAIEMRDAEADFREAWRNLTAADRNAYWAGQEAEQL